MKNLYEADVGCDVELGACCSTLNGSSLKFLVSSFLLLKPARMFVFCLMLLVGIVVVWFVVVVVLAIIHSRSYVSSQARETWSGCREREASAR